MSQLDPRIVVSRGPDRLMVLPLLVDVTIKVGRGPDCDLQIPDQAVSRHQCDLTLSEVGVHLKDRSGAGTNVNGKPVKEATLAPGAVVELGAIRLELSAIDDSLAHASTLSGRGGTDQLNPSAPSTVGPMVLAGVLPGGKRFRAHLGSVLNIGRDGGNDLVINAPFISAFHGRISKRADGWYVEDLGSKNGTFLNGIKVREARVEVGQVLRFGEIEFSLVPVEAAPPSRKILTRNARMLEVLEAASKAAKTSWPVLVTGERGTGKELVARALHEQSGRPRLVTLNCSAVPAELIESELFGHEKGTFTGASQARAGKFEQADGGTLFLDEVGDMPAKMQAKVLRVLQEGEVERLGSDEVRKVDVRVIAATNQPLHEMLKDGRFRADLFDRLNVVRIELPPLRERVEDIELLAGHFLGQHLGELGRALRFSGAALAAIRANAWPGNIRELKAAVMRSILAAKGAEIQPADLGLGAGKSVEPVEGKSLQNQVAATEKEVIEREIARCGSLRAAAKALGMAKSTLQEKVKKLGIKT
ncbi:MAG TPA: sigma 54-interacting transcriptional regulator [Verrucomicrobiota bacterium]|nr:sigma 54-interacting transcriptional regulator [Verrucomicrobiota bacterium]